MKKSRLFVFICLMLISVVLFTACSRNTGLRDALANTDFSNVMLNFHDDSGEITSRTGIDGNKVKFFRDLTDTDSLARLISDML